MSLCDSCKYQYYVEQLKPCIIYRNDCEFYEPDDFHEEPKTMTNEEAIKHLRFVLSALNENSQIAKSYRMAIKALEQGSKTGHWIRWYEQKEHDSYTENIPHCKCSECGKEYDPHSSQFIKYCNECGAKMSESEGIK